MDKNLRTSLRTVVAACRKVLEEDMRRQLEGTYGVTPSGEFIPREDVEPYAVDVPLWRRERDEILAAVAHIESYGTGRASAVEQFVRESGFTVLNRIAALKLMEHPSRGLIPEAVGSVKDSKGFALFQKVSPEVCRAARNGTVLDSGYRLFLESIFDDVAEELGVLFDRRLPQSIIFPSDTCLKQVLELLNQPEVAAVWSEDETIGWIYQYFIPKELRDEAREASKAPRNSYELAFRNQFFTPRYVVEFLVDNTLGRVWYEMRRGETGIVDSCKYLIHGTGGVLRPPGAAPRANVLAPVPNEAPSVCSADVPHRSKKDPRDLRLLDPACGSGHFLLYSYDLFEAIYLEAWDDPESPPCEETGRQLRADYPERDVLECAVPELIVRYNLHGIDIDLRATQIATLAMWLRVQRSYQQRGIKVSGRPRITRSNTVCAEPMPGQRELLDEFTRGLEPRLLGQLVRVVFEKLALAGEAGTLLEIESEVRGAVAEAKAQWVAGPQPEQLMLFPQGGERPIAQLELFDVRSVTDESFWQEAEGRVIEALRSYASSASNGQAYRRRLFAEDTAQGFAFVDLCRKRFDVVVMNPPFGDGVPKAREYVDQHYPSSKLDLATAFVDRGTRLLCPGGFLGAITTRTVFLLPHSQPWRRDVLSAGDRITTAADLGYGVLDSAFVETAAYVVSAGGPNDTTTWFRLVDAEAKDEGLLAEISRVRNDQPSANTFLTSAGQFGALPGTPFSYWAPRSVFEMFQRLPAFESDTRFVRCGMGTLDDFRFLRAWWEIRPEDIGRSRDSTLHGAKWVSFAKGGSAAPFCAPLPLVVSYANDGAELKAYITAKVGSASRKVQAESFYFVPGLTFGRRVRRLSPACLPAGVIFSDSSNAVFLAGGDGALTMAYLGLLNAGIVRHLLALFAPVRKMEVGFLQRLPVPVLFGNERELQGPAARAIATTLQALSEDEVSQWFIAPGSAIGQPKDGPDFDGSAQLRAARQSQVKSAQRELDAAGTALFALPPEDNAKLSSFASGAVDGEDDDDEDGTEDPSETDAHEAASLVSWALGCVFGRWDLRKAGAVFDWSQVDPFGPWPIFPPGMLLSPDGGPARESPPDYSVHVDWDGILVDDPGHVDDIASRIRRIFEGMWPQRCDDVEKRVCALLRTKDLGEYFRNPRGFFEHHLRSYSKNRRKAPIYWLLQSARKSYGLWIYYPRLDRDMVFKAIHHYTEPKIKQEAARLKDLRQRLDDAREAPTRRDRTKIEKEIERQDSLLGELGTFRESLERVSALGYEPDLDDGVVLNIAPFHEITPWKDARTYWKELRDGGFPWSSIAKRLREREPAGPAPAESASNG